MDTKSFYEEDDTIFIFGYPVLEFLPGQYQSVDISKTAQAIIFVSYSNEDGGCFLEDCQFNELGSFSKDGGTFTIFDTGQRVQKGTWWSSVL